MKFHQTEKGTQLPIMDIRGKDYLEVKYRIVWFREDHPTWTIQTELFNVTEDSAYARATISDESGRIIATSHKFESIQGFPDFIEKAETGAIGRALALLGYGTQFCSDELDEGARIVDSPRDPKPKPNKDIPEALKGGDLGDYKIPFGDYKGKRIKDIDIFSLDKMVNWCRDKRKFHDFAEVAEKFLKTREFER